ncbi:hypothetical protein FOCC_FOCC016889 [Frankliniella occidentalis]|nr:hypothetical protein FOCC_FOCC016889 [Frankliniella occidentalis]
MMDMIIIYEECGFNERAALALYRQRFGERPNQPYRQQFPKLHARLLDRGTFDARPGPVQGAPFPRRVRTPEAVALVRQTFEGRPNTSVRATGMALGMSKTTVHEMVRSDLHLKPWKRAQVQKLKPGDPPIRARVCKEFMDLVDEAQANPLFPGDRFVNRVIWSDECLVSNEGYFNAHNSHHWAPEDDNPHCTIQTHVQGRFKVMPLPFPDSQEYERHPGGPQQQQQGRNEAGEYESQSSGPPLALALGPLRTRSPRGRGELRGGCGQGGSTASADTTDGSGPALPYFFVVVLVVPVDAKPTVEATPARSGGIVGGLGHCAARRYGGQDAGRAGGPSGRLVGLVPVGVHGVVIASYTEPPVWWARTWITNAVFSTGAMAVVAVVLEERGEVGLRALVEPALHTALRAREQLGVLAVPDRHALAELEVICNKKEAARTSHLPVSVLTSAPSPHHNRRR